MITSLQIGGHSEHLDDPTVRQLLELALSDQMQTVAALDSLEDKRQACGAVAAALQEVRDPGRLAALEAIAESAVHEADPDDQFQLFATLLEVNGDGGRWVAWLDQALVTVRNPVFGHGFPQNRDYAYRFLSARVPVPAEKVVGLLGRELWAYVGEPRSHLLRHLASQAELYARALPADAVEHLAERLIEAAAMWP